MAITVAECGGYGFKILVNMSIRSRTHTYVPIYFNQSLILCFPCLTQPGHPISRWKLFWKFERRDNSRILFLKKTSSFFSKSGKDNICDWKILFEPKRWLSVDFPWFRRDYSGRIQRKMRTKIAAIKVSVF